MPADAPLSEARRPCLWFTIPARELPPDTTCPGDVSLALVHLTSTEEIDAIRSAAGDGARAKFELAKAAMRGVDGRAIDRARLEEQEVWEKIGSKGRSIVMAVFEELCAASKDGVETAKASFRAGSVRGSARTRRASFYALLAGSELGTREHLDAIFDRLAWVTRYSKGAVTLREALGLPAGAPMSAWAAAHVRARARAPPDARARETAAERSDGGRMSLEYNVVANLILQGDGSASTRLDAVAGHADRVSRALTGIGQRAAAGMAMVGSAVGGAIDRMASLAASTAKWGALVAAGGAIAATKVGLFDVNAQLEKTELGFATLFTMFGSAPDFAGGLQMGRQLLEGIRQDAAALPGEFHRLHRAEAQGDPDRPGAAERRVPIPVNLSAPSLPKPPGLSELLAAFGISVPMNEAPTVCPLVVDAAEEKASTP